mgnify:CR=1 FL=1
MKKLHFVYVLLFLAVISLGIASCQKNNSETTSTLQIRLTDGPGDYEEVNVDIKDVKVKFNDDGKLYEILYNPIKYKIINFWYKLFAL